MAIKIYEKFAPRANPADGNYPYGSIKNESVPGAKDGTPLDAVWANDMVGTDAELFAQAGIVPNGQPDKLGASQRVNAIKIVARKSLGASSNYIEASEIDGQTVSHSVLISYDEIIFAGETINTSMTPTDAIPNYVGYGTVNVTDIFGNVHACKVENLTLKNRNKDMFSEQITAVTSDIQIGFIGDSITDGADALTFSGTPVTGADLNPTIGTEQDGNLSSTNYNHSTSNGGWNSWAAKFGRLATDLSGVQIKIYNTASSSKNIVSGWQYRNLDYGFFQNNAYENKIPSRVVIAHGMNDVVTAETADEYKDKIRQLIRKLHFFGAEVCWAIPVSIPKSRSITIECIQSVCSELNINFIKLYEILSVYEGESDLTFYDLWSDPASGTLDLVHPNNGGHAILACVMLKDIYKERIQTIESGQSIDMTRAANADMSHITYFNVEDVAAYGRSQISAGFIDENAVGSVSIYVWANKPLSLCCRTLYKNNFTSSFFLVNSNCGNVKQTHITKRPTGNSQVKKPHAARVCRIPYGLSKITFQATSAQEGGEVPLIEFTDINVTPRLGLSKKQCYANKVLPIYTGEEYYPDPKNAVTIGSKYRIDFSGLAEGESVLLSDQSATVGIQLNEGVFRLKDFDTGGVIIDMGSSKTLWMQSMEDGAHAGISEMSLSKLADKYFNVAESPIEPSCNFPNNISCVVSSIEANSYTSVNSNQ